jgi:hypothetical protein
MKPSKSSSWFTSRLEAHRSQFHDTEFPLSTAQENRLKKVQELLFETTQSQNNGSVDRRCRRRIARTFLLDVFRSLGCEIFLLCSLVFTITELSLHTYEGLISPLRTWWRDTQHPSSLTQMASEICAGFRLSGFTQNQERFKVVGISDRQARCSQLPNDLVTRQLVTANQVNSFEVSPEAEQQPQGRLIIPSHAQRLNPCRPI